MTFLDISLVKKRFGGLKAADDISLSLEQGSLTALVGPNGCGKSTLFNLITGALPVDSGSIIFKGEEITSLPAHKIARKGMGRKFQVPAIFPELTVLENLQVPSLQKAGLFNRKASSGQLSETLKTINLSVKKEALAETLSHGEKQWLEIGMILMQSPDLILLDEPTAGMTAAETRATAELIHRINKQEKITLLVIEHDIGFIEQLDCQIHVMARGKFLKSGDFKSIRNDPEVQELYFGKAAADHA